MGSPAASRVQQALSLIILLGGTASCSREEDAAAPHADAGIVTPIVDASSGWGPDATVTPDAVVVRDAPAVLDAMAVVDAGAAVDAAGDAMAAVDARPMPGSDVGTAASWDSGMGPPLADAGGQMNGGPVAVGMPCASAGSFGGSLLVCAAGRWRYALRSDVPDGTYGGFTARPDWFPPLKTVLGIPASLSSCPAGKLALVEAPLDPAEVPSIVPYGAMIGDHVTPIDHMYFGVSTLNLSPAARAAAAFLPIRAPADGVIIEASSLGSPTSMRVVIAHACESASVFMVVNRLSGVLAAYQDQVSGGARLRMEIPIKAGDVFGLQRDNPLDFSLHDGATWLSGYAHPFPYVSAEAWRLYTVDPMPYWSSPLSQMYQAKMQRTEAPRAGRIDWDKAGTAAGSWYLEGTIGYSGQLVSVLQNATAPVPGGVVAGKKGYSWSHLSLAPHWVQPSIWMASIGAWNDPAGDFRQLAIKPGPPSPDAVTVASGVVVYELVTWLDADANGNPLSMGSKPIGYRVVLQAQVQGVLAVRVNPGNTITVEKRPDLNSASAFTDFGSKAETYWH